MFWELIELESAKISALHKKVHETVKNRSKDVESWKRACKLFHSYVSPLDSLIDKLYKFPQLSDAEIMEFSIAFFEVNPMFFRSGYIKEDMLRKIKRTPLSLPQKNRLISVLLDAAEKRPYREYKGYCRLAMVIGNQQLVEGLKTLCERVGKSEKSRAELMLAYIYKSKNLNLDSDLSNEMPLQ